MIESNKTNPYCSREKMKLEKSTDQIAVRAALPENFNTSAIVISEQGKLNRLSLQLNLMLQG